MVTPHSSPEKGLDQSSVMYPRSSVMYARSAKAPPRTWTPPCNTSRTRTPETSRAPANKYSHSRGGSLGRGGLGMKRKCASEGCLSSKCYIREISKGLDKMIIKVKTPPPSPDNFPMGWSTSSGDSDNTMQCFPHSFMKHKNKQGTSPPSSLSHLQSRDAMMQFPETNSPPKPNPSGTAMFHHSPIASYGNSASPAASNCSRTLWSVQEDGDDDDENGFVMGMDYTVTASPVKGRFASEAYQHQQHDEKFVPKRVIQLRGENGIRAGMFVRDAVFFKRSGK